MKEIVLGIFVFLFGIRLFADEIDTSVQTNQSPYFNIREGASRLINITNEEEVSKRYKDTKEMGVLRKIILDKSVNRCATKIVGQIKTQLKIETADDVELAILGLRLDNSIDDVSADILLKANKVDVYSPIPISNNRLTAEEEKDALTIFKTKKIDVNNEEFCIEDTYKDLVDKLYSKNTKFLKNLKHINKIAYSSGLISGAKFKTLEKLRYSKVYEWPLTLSEYSDQLDRVSKKFPARKIESADLVTKIISHQKISQRQSLYEKYDSTQIILLANIIRDMKLRLDSKEITININYGDRPTEVISLTSMERFRFVLKLLRKELSTINNSSLLNGRFASFMDLITAGYEVGYISSNEILQLSSLHEIWDPIKTKREKVLFWVQNFGGIASVILPPPYGFISMFAIMVIDQESSNLSVDRDPDYNIF